MTKEQFMFIKRIAMSEYFLCCCLEVTEFIACQFALESDYGKSSLALNANNLCGMKKPFSRIGLFEVDEITGNPCQTESGFVMYVNSDFCILDYLMWLSYQHFTQDEMNNLSLFVIHLRNSGYCPEKGYIDIIQSIYQQFKSYKNE